MFACQDQDVQEDEPQGLSSQTYRYLALGDSYTIGTAIGVDSSYSAQLVDSLEASQEADSVYYQVIATNGWTTADLQNGINRDQPDSSFDVVTILIGVNNQYQRRSIPEYEIEFRSLLDQAIIFAANRKERVLVVSIPDWGVSPAGAGNRAQVASEIDAFNAAQKAICDSLQVDFVNITEISRQGLNDPQLIARDGLHFSKAMHRLWMKELYASWYGKITAQ